MNPYTHSLSIPPRPSEITLFRSALYGERSKLMRPDRKDGKKKPGKSRSRALAAINHRIEKLETLMSNRGIKTGDIVLENEDELDV